MKILSLVVRVVAVFATVLVIIFRNTTSRVKVLRHAISMLMLILFAVRLTRGGVLGGVISGDEVLTLPVGSDEATCLFEVRSKVHMLFPAHNLGFHSATCFSPLVHNLLRLFITTFLLQFPVLVLKPDLFHLLFINVSSGIVVEVVRAAFEPVLGLELHGVASRVELAKGVSAYSLFFLAEVVGLRDLLL